jgi:mono/diheme cytochrome c family protein
MRLLSTICLLVFLSSVSVIHAQQPGGSDEGKKLKKPVASSAASIEAGAKTFMKMCAFCHGKDAGGNGPMVPKGMTTPPSLIDAKWDRGSTDGEIFLVLRHGAGPKFEMKAVPSKVSDQELWNVVNYLRSLGPKGKSD